MTRGIAGRVARLAARTPSGFGPLHALLVEQENPQDGEPPARCVLVQHALGQVERTIRLIYRDIPE